MKFSDSFKGLMLVVLSGTAFGLLPLFLEMGVSAGMSTATLYFLRFLIGSVFMFFLMLFRHLPMMSGKETVCCLLLGIVGYFLQSFWYSKALDTVGVATTALLYYTYPAFVMICSVLFLKEKITKRKLLALVMALVGALIIVGGKIEGDFHGILYAMGASLIYTAYVTVSSVAVRGGYEIQSCAFIMLGATISYGVMNILYGFTVPEQATGYVGALLLGLVSTVIAFWCFFAGMDKVGPSTASLASTTEPLVSVIVSVLFLQQEPTLRVLFGGIFILGVLVVSAMKSKRETKL